jgi:hypothetical protein
MRLSQAVGKLGKTSLDGLSGGSWEPGILTGSLRPWTETEAGAKTRSFIAVEALGNFSVVRTSLDQEIYLVQSKAQDHSAGAIHGYGILLRRALVTAQIYGFTTGQAASGAKINKVEQLLATVYCDMERASAQNSGEFAQVTYTETVFYLPGDTLLDTDKELKVGASYYEVREVFQDGSLVKALAVKR